MHFSQRSTACREAREFGEVLLDVVSVVCAAARRDADDTAEAADSVEELTKVTLASRLVCGKEGSARFAVDPAQYRVVCVIIATRYSGHNNVRV